MSNEMIQGKTWPLPVAVLMCAIAVSGCSIRMGQPFETAHVKQIVVGSTTQKEILETLGSPASQGLKDGHPLWTYLDAHLSLFRGTAEGTMLSIEFDEQGIVQSYSYVPY